MEMDPTLLPPLNELFVNTEPARQAYDRILPWEGEKPEWIRLLGYMLIYAPSEGALLEVAQDINACSNNADVLNLGEYYLKFFVKFFKQTARPSTESASSHPSQLVVDAMRDNIFESITTTPIKHIQAKVNALIRDNYRCMVTRHIDMNCYKQRRNLHVHGQPSALTKTNCSHILPQYIFNEIEYDMDRRTTASVILTIVERYGGIHHTEIIERGLHHSTNVLTLDNNLHAFFDDLEIWFDPIEGMDNTYTIGRRFTGVRPDLPETITFESTTARLSPPDPRYLALHAACAKIIHLSGAT